MRKQDERGKRRKTGMGKNQIIIIIAAVILLAGAGGGIGFYLYNSGQKAEVAEEKAKEADPDKIQEQYDKLKEVQCKRFFGSGNCRVWT